MRKIVVYLITILGFCFYLQHVSALPLKACQQLFPHWNCSNILEKQQLDKLYAAILRNANKGYIAASDWDGTLYDEVMRQKSGPLKGEVFSGQATWLNWSAGQLHKHRDWFPLFRTDAANAGDNLINRNLYLEGKTNATLGNYSKFSQIANFTAGMSTRAVYRSVKGYLKAYSVKDYVFMPMLDVLQVLHDNGYKLWIITGSNPFYVAPIIKTIEKNLFYTKKKHYDFGITKNRYRGNKPGNIAGNAAMLRKKGRYIFSMVYDNQFVTSSKTVTINKERYIVNNKGKARAIKNYIQPKEKVPVVWYMGNSSGDYEAVNYVLSNNHYGKNDTTYTPFMVVVHPRGERIGRLSEILNKYPQHSVEVSMINYADR